MVEQHTTWRTLSQFVQIRSPWLTLIGEKLEDENHRVLDYWRIEKADSVIIITLQNNQFLLPKPMYRPGLGQTTLDFPGGRVTEGKTPVESVSAIITKELGVRAKAITSLTQINPQGWAVNSSFSNQKLYGFVAEINPQYSLDTKHLGSTYPNTSEGINSLLQDLTCLQCRGIFLDWLSSRWR